MGIPPRLMHRVQAFNIERPSQVRGDQLAFSNNFNVPVGLESALGKIE